ncbi:MAG: hypothetical protein DCF32_05660 [Leptolyngbya sp.]|nr:MAG: hypothetical protein DCF32_05660 [Leptolyngbya sp.]
MTSLDDLTLLQWFVSGDATLEANQSLRIQPANNLRQLLGRKGSLLATAYDATTPARIEVRRHTDYTDVLHQVLIDYHFLPIGQGLDSQVLCYAHHPVPQGYRVNYTAARQMWKQWWIQHSRRGNRPLQLDLLVLASHQWYPIRAIAINSGTLYVDTLRGENVYHGDDLVAWLEKEPCKEGEKNCVWAPPPGQAAPAPIAEPPVAVATVPLRAQAPAPLPLRSPIAPAHQTTVDPTLAPVVYALDGKIYIQTAVGVVVVEGKELRAYRSLHQSAIAFESQSTTAAVSQRPR